MAVTIPRGVRLANPGNIRKSAEAWQGLSDKQDDPAFFTFSTPVWGIRAMARILIAYQDKYALNCVRYLISRWAPPADMNDTASYIGEVCKRTLFTPDQVLDLHTYDDLKPLVTAIIWHENGQCPYTDAQIDSALKLAGVTKDQPVSNVAAIAKDPKVIAASIAGSLAAVQGAVSSVSSIWDTLNGMFDPRYIVWTCAAAAIAFGVYLVWEKLHNRKLGIV